MNAGEQWDIDIPPYPNKGLSEFLAGPEILSALEEHAQIFMAMYEMRLAQNRKTGELQSSGTYWIDVGSSKNDRLVAIIDYNAPYAAAFEYGNAHQDGHHYFNEVLSLMGGVE